MALLEPDVRPICLRLLIRAFLWLWGNSLWHTGWVKAVQVARGVHTSHAAWKHTKVKVTFILDPTKDNGNHWLMLLWLKSHLWPYYKLEGNIYLSWATKCTFTTRVIDAMLTVIITDSRSSITDSRSRNAKTFTPKSWPLLCWGLAFLNVFSIKPLTLTAHQTLVGQFWLNSILKNFFNLGWQLTIKTGENPTDLHWWNMQTC